MSKVRVGIVGCGSIGSFVAGKIQQEFKSTVSVESIFDINSEKAQLLRDKIPDAKVVFRLKDVFVNTDLVIEAAAPGIVEEVLLESKVARTNLVIMSVGGLLGKTDLMDVLRKKGVKIYIPSGAIGGMDIFRSLGSSWIDTLTLTTFKPPVALSGVDYIVEKGIDLYSITDEKVIFEGSVRDAVKNFPKNINVAATLAINSGVEDKIKVKIVVSPALKRNIHHIVAEGDFGKVEITCENNPSKENPRTSQLALLSCWGKVCEAVEDISSYSKESRG